MGAIGCAALEIVDTRYSDGYPNFAGGALPASDMAYHNGYHGRQVGRDGGGVAEASGFSPAVVRLTKAAGNAHDLVQRKGRGIDEAESAAWLAEKLRRAGFSEATATIGSLAIIGTEPTFESGRLVGQKATTMEYPSKEAQQVAYSVASGDLGVLYAPIGPYMGHQLWREIQGVNPHDEPEFDIPKIAGFQGDQIKLLDTHQYPLPAARAVLATHEAEVRAYSEQVYNQLAAGEITSWQQLIDQDLAFMRQHTA